MAQKRVVASVDAPRCQLKTSPSMIALVVVFGVVLAVIFALVLAQLVRKDGGDTTNVPAADSAVRSTLQLQQHHHAPPPETLPPIHVHIDQEPPVVHIHNVEQRSAGTEPKLFAD